MNFLPAKDKILIEPDKGADKSQGGLIVPDQYVKAADQGKIIAVGKMTDPNDSYRPGQRVMFYEHAGIQVNMNGKKYKLMGVGELFGTILADTILSSVK